MTIYFDPESGEWMTIDNNGNIKEWNGQHIDDAYELGQQYPVLPKGSNVDFNNCEHKWHLYDSGFTIFEFCTICDAKRDVLK